MNLNQELDQFLKEPGDCLDLNKLKQIMDRHKEPETSEIVILRMENTRLQKENNFLFKDNKHLLCMIWVLLAACEELENEPICKKSIEEFQKLWKESGRKDKHTTKVKNAD